MSQTPRLEEVLESAIGTRLSNFYTSLPGEVVGYDPATRRADIRIKVMNASEDSAGKKAWFLPIIRQVLVMFPGGHSSDGEYFGVTHPLKVGDQVLYIVSTLPLHEWMVRGYSNLEIDPILYNNLSSGFALPGIHTTLTEVAEAAQDALVIHGEKVKVGGATGTEPTFKADTFLSRFENFLSVLESEINLVALGVGTTIRNAWIATGVKTTNTEVK